MLSSMLGWSRHLHRHAQMWRPIAVLACWATVVGLFASRAFFAVLYALPAAMGDSVMFLSVSSWHCNTGFLGNPFGPPGATGPTGMIWHGFVSPMLYSWANPGCLVHGFYAVHCILLAATAGSAWFIGRALRLTQFQTLGLVAAVFALQARLQFRPEALAVLQILWIEWAARRGRLRLQGALFALLAWTQPTIFALMFIYAVLAKTSQFRPSLWTGGPAFLIVALLLGAIYPFPFRDLINGMLRQADNLVSRGDGSIFTYYVRSDFFPLWGFLLLGVYAIRVRHRPLMLVLAPFIYWFGLRTPPTSYNLVPVFVALLLGALEDAKPSIGTGLALVALLVGFTGQAQMSLRDGLTVANRGDTLASARGAIRSAFIDPSVQIGRLPPYAVIIAPEIPVTFEWPVVAYTYNPGAATIVDFAMLSGRGDTLCPLASPDARHLDGLRLRGVKVFNSESGWSLAQCERPARTQPTP